MIKQMRILLRVKELKQDQAFRAMQVKRGRVEAAREATRRAREIVAESARTYRAREDAIFDAVMGRVIDREAIDGTHAAVVQLEKDHTALKDAVERAIHVEHRLEKELEEAVALYRAAVKVRDKYLFLTDDMQQKADAEADGKEEEEIEDLFSRPPARAA